MSKLIETLAEELERPREVTQQVSKHIWGTYEIDRDAIGDFLDSMLPDLEDYEHELILSPLFTPKLADQALFAQLLGKEHIPKTEWPGLVEQLAARPTCGQLVTSDEVCHTVTLREDILERYVSHLRLGGAIPGSLWSLLHQGQFVADLPTLLAVARRAIWESDARRNILETYLTAAAHRDLYHSGDGILLLKFAEDYKPADMDHLIELIAFRQEALRQEIETADDPKPFFHEQIQARHGFDKDHRQRDGGRIAVKKEELAFLERLHQVLIR